MNITVKEFINFIKPLGFTQRVDNYYLLIQKEGYVNVSYCLKKSLFCNKAGVNSDIIDSIDYTKNFYKQGIVTIDESFFFFDEFVKFMEQQHPQIFRKQKLHQLNLL